MTFDDFLVELAIVVVTLWLVVELFLPNEDIDIDDYDLF